MALLLIAGVSYAGVSQWMMLYHAAAPWAVVVLLGPLWLTAWGIVASRFGAWGMVLGAVAGLVAFAFVLRGGIGDPNLLYMLQHVSINVLLCGWFGASLRGDGLSLIGQFAARVHPMSPAMCTYTGNVTRVWTLYFALMAVASVAVYASLSFAAWSVLANLLTPLCIVGLFVGEHLLRYRLHPEFERTRMIDAVRAFYGAPADPAARR
ncbi:putative membrane protein [Variovorax sp. PBL-E5]|nr:putative membrane protein [Variovorax sp. PBL-E5]